jgi:pimeloyl-ACP methyl ester carboxylesterase
MRRWLVRLLIGAVLVISWPAPSPADPGAVVHFPIPHVLVYDRHGDGRVVEVVGDLSTADHVAVLVPGMATTLGNFDQGLGGVQQRSPRWQAEQLYAAAASRIAVVAWLGYDPPNTIGLAAIRSESAVAGGKALVQFVNGLVAYRPDVSITLIGHSYGSLVLAYAAARLPAQVTDLISLGSPGMDIGRAADLHSTARLWVGSAAGDWTRWLPDLRLLGLGHGTNPQRPWFGARHLDVTGVTGHDGYFVPGTASLHSMAAVVLGEPA